MLLFFEFLIKSAVVTERAAVLQTNPKLHICPQVTQQNCTPVSEQHSFPLFLELEVLHQFVIFSFFTFEKRPLIIELVLDLIGKKF